MSDVLQDVLRGPQCVGWHEILKGVLLLLRCVGFETCVTVSGFRESRAEDLLDEGTNLLENRADHSSLYTSPVVIRGQMKTEYIRVQWVAI